MVLFTLYTFINMNIETLARMIPDRIRSERLLVESDPINTAISFSGNPNMQLLVAIWDEFVEPNNKVNSSCPICLGTIINNFKALYPILLEMEKQSKLLDKV